MSQTPPPHDAKDHAHGSPPDERVFNAVLVLAIGALLVAGMYSARNPLEGAEEQGAAEASSHGGGGEAGENGKEGHARQGEPKPGVAPPHETAKAHEEKPGKEEETPKENRE